MKKTLSLILAFVLCLSLCACGASKEDVKNAIIRNRWNGTDESGAEYQVTFLNNNQAEIYCAYTTGFKYTFEGTYEVKEDSIVVTDTLNAADFYIDYTFKNGKISLTLNVLGIVVPLEAGGPAGPL